MKNHSPDPFVAPPQASRSLHYHGGGALAPRRASLYRRRLQTLGRLLLLALLLLYLITSLTPVTAAGERGAARFATARPAGAQSANSPVGDAR